jgi:hypothetical protein
MQVASTDKASTVHGEAYTQNINSFRALLKRGIVGSFHEENGLE